MPNLLIDLPALLPFGAEGGAAAALNKTGSILGTAGALALPKLQVHCAPLAQRLL